MICENPMTVGAAADGFRREPLGEDAGCYEVRGYNPMNTTRRLVCWEFEGGRSLRVNGVATPCVSDEGFMLGPPRANGYCIEVGAGGRDFAGFLLPTR